MSTGTEWTAWRGQVAVIGATPGRAIWDEDGNSLLDLSDFEVIVRGRPQTFTPAVKDYARAGIADASDMPPALRLIRFLAYLNPGQLFGTDEELLEAAGRPDSELSRFLQLNDWHQPDPLLKERPSDSPCLRSLAQALSLRDASQYECPDAEKNTHWSNWI